MRNIRNSNVLQYEHFWELSTNKINFNKVLLMMEEIKKQIQELIAGAKKMYLDSLGKFLKKDFIIGVDLGSNSVKIVQFAEKEDGLHLLRTDLKEMKICDKETENENEILSALRYLLKGVDVKKSRIIVNINCPHTAIKKITAPYMPRTELKEGLRLEAKNYFSFTVDESLLDFEILGDIVEKGVRKYEVIVAVSPQKTVNRYLSLLGKAGINPASLICTSYALQKIAEHSHSSAIGGSASGGKEDETRCFIDIGDLHTELIIMKGKYLMFSRKIPVAGSDFTKAMTGTLVSDRGKTQLSLDEAEKIKREVGLPSQAESKIIDDKISTTQILSMLRTPLEQLTSEIERCLDYYREESGGGRVDSVILFGGGASLAGLIQSLSESLGIEVKLGDSLEGINIEKDAVREREKVSHRLELAIASALSGAKGINLLPPEIKEETKRTFKRSGIEATVVGAVLVLVLIYIGMRINLNNFQKKIAVAKMELSSLGPELKQVAIFGLLAKEPYWDDVFKELSNIIPPDIYLTELSMENNVIRMHGIVNSQEPEESLSNFILTLERGIFKNVKLITTKEITGKTANEFEITCWIDGG